MPHEGRRLTQGSEAVGVSGKVEAIRAPSENPVQFHKFSEEYVQRLVQRDRPTEEHFAAYFGELLGMKLRGRVRSRDAMEEVRQETFVRVVQTLRTGGLDHPERLGAFVNSVCNNVLFEWYRGEGRYTPMGDEAQDQADSRIDLDAPLINQERRYLVEGVLRKLPRRDQALLRMVFLEETDRAQACERLGVGESYFRVLLHRAKSRFAEQLVKSVDLGVERFVWWSPLKRRPWRVHETVRYSNGT